MSKSTENSRISISKEIIKVKETTSFKKDERIKSFEGENTSTRISRLRRTPVTQKKKPKKMKDSVDQVYFDLDDGEEWDVDLGNFLIARG